MKYTINSQLETNLSASRSGKNYEGVALILQLQHTQLQEHGTPGAGGNLSLWIPCEMSGCFPLVGVYTIYVVQRGEASILNMTVGTTDEPSR
jgi:hypothetical protein